LVVHWKGGVHTELRLPRRRRGQNSSQTSREIIDAVRMLVRICSDDLIAGVLNRNGLLTGRGNRWTRERVTSLRNPVLLQRQAHVGRVDESDRSCPLPPRQCQNPASRR
jgi:hypothetical protein